MALPDTSVTVADAASGVEHALMTASGKVYPVVVEAGPSGHIKGSTDKYTLQQAPRVGTAAATDWFDLFNAAGSGKILRIHAVYPMVDPRAATTFIKSFVFHALMTSAVGTGGAAHTYKSTTVPLADGAVDISPYKTSLAALPAQVTARSVPTGGATVKQHLFTQYLVLEELHETSLYQGINMVPLIGTEAFDAYDIAEGEGFKIRCSTAVAMTGMAVGWLVIFDLV